MNAPTPHIANPPPPPLQHAEIRLIVIGVLLAMSLAALDQTIVATALPTIGRELGDAEMLPWVVTSYLVTSTAIAPLYGKISDTHGRRKTLLWGIGIFLAGSIACALAPSMTALVIGRAIQGLGGGGLISLGQTVVADVVAPKERGRYQVYFASMFALSSLLGPVLGGVFAEHLHWSVIFWINLPLGAGAMLMSDRLLKRLPRHDRPHRLDLLGAALLVVATVSLMLALNWGGIRYPWSSATILSLLGTSAVFWIGFALRLGSADEPLIPLSILANDVVLNSTLAALFAMGVFIGLSVYVPAYMELVLGLSAADSGLALIPLMVGTVLGATSAGRAMIHLVHYKRLPMGGLLLAMTTTALLAWRAEGLPFWQLEVLLALTSVGIGTLFPITTVCIQNAVSPHQMGTATGTLNFSRSLGGAILVAAFGAILLAGGIATGLHGAPAAGGHAAVTPAMVEAFRTMFMACTGVLAVSFVFLWRMEERPLRGRSPAPAAAGGE